MAGILDVFDKVTVLNDFAEILEKTDVIDFFVDIKNKGIRVEIGSEQLIPKTELFAFAEQVKSVYGLIDLEIKVKYRGVEFSEKYYRNLLVSLFKK